MRMRELVALFKLRSCPLCSVSLPPVSWVGLQYVRSHRGLVSSLYVLEVTNAFNY